MGNARQLPRPPYSHSKVCDDKFDHSGIATQLLGDMNIPIGKFRNDAVNVFIGMQAATGKKTRQEDRPGDALDNPGQKWLLFQKGDLYTGE